MAERNGIPRRSFVKSAVAIGGSAALSACVGRFGEPDVPTGVEEPSTLPDRQHAWNDVLPSDEHGNDVPPRHHVVLLLEYDGEWPPDSAERETVEAAFQALERAYEWSNEGLLFTVGYSPRYFGRYDDPLPEGVELPEPTALAPFEDPDPDEPDAIVHLASDHGQVVLAAEESLTGEQSTLNGVDAPTSLDDVFEVTDRRTGFVGEGLPAENDDAAGVPEGNVPDDSPLFMGFESGFERNQASEDLVTIQDGPFAGGTTQHLSLIRLHLRQWYEQDSRYHREATMFCPFHAEEDLIEGTGDDLADEDGVAERGCPAHAKDDASEHGKVGHAQKTARAREDGDPLILRRDFDSTDDGRASVHFLSLHRSIEDFVRTREAMNGTDVADEGAVGERLNNGILQYMTVERRGNYLLPPRPRRALPRPTPQ